MFLEALSGEDSITLREMGMRCKIVGTLSLPAIIGRGKGKNGVGEMAQWLIALMLFPRM